MSAPDVRRLLEEIIMTSATWPVYSPFAREHYGRGQAEGKAEEAVRMLLLVLGARGFDISDDMHTRISTCADLAQLESWATRAVTAQSLEDLFDETGGQHP
ncbi:hypothetical protein [Nonomuraea angiospora]